MAQVKKRGEGGEERKEGALLLPSLSFIGSSFHFSRGQNRESRSSVFHCSDTKRKRFSMQASVIQTWLVEPFTELKSAQHMAKIIQHKSQTRALKPISKV